MCPRDPAPARAGGGRAALCLTGLFSLTSFMFSNISYNKSKREAKESCLALLRKMSFLFPVRGAELVFGPGCSLSPAVTCAAALPGSLLPSRHPARARGPGAWPPAQLRSGPGQPSSVNGNVP